MAAVDRGLTADVLARADARPLGAGLAGPRCLFPESKDMDGEFYRQRRSESAPLESESDNIEFSGFNRVVPRMQRFRIRPS
jgi:hypothetical protein